MQQTDILITKCVRLFLSYSDTYRKNVATSLSSTRAASAMIMPIMEYLTISLPVSIRSSSPAAVRYMSAPTTSMIMARIPTIPRRKFKTLVRMATIESEALTLAGAAFQPNIPAISLRNEGAAMTERNGV